jgi:hypothetical protein
MNALESVTSKICSAREILDCAIVAHEDHNHSKVEHLLHAVDEFLVYYLQEFDEKFKDAWKSTVGDLRDGDVKDDGMRPWGHSDLEYQIANKKEPLACDKDDASPECQGAWNDFWEENYYPEEYHTNLSKEIEAIREAGGYEWTPEPQVSRNDPTRLKYEGGWIYESPDGGKTVTKRKVGSTEKFVVKQDKVTKWLLPVEPDPSGEYFVTFPDDLLEAADLQEGDQVEWVDQGDGSYLIKKVTQPLGMDEC